MKKIELTWYEILERLKRFESRYKGRKVYGIPKNGMLLCAFLSECEVTYNPAEADVFLDDLIDSGRTRAKYAADYERTPFIALYNKQEEADINGHWLAFPWEDSHDREDIVTRMIQAIGEDPTREGLLETPNRVVRSWSEIYGGYLQDAKEILDKSFASDSDEMVICKDIEFFSTCEHHLLPFVGKCHIGYIPDGKVVGVSKLARTVDAFARRMQIQENMTSQIANSIAENIQCVGVGVVVEAKHYCIASRGVKKQESVMQTSCLLGNFKRLEVRNEFLKLIGRG